MTDSPFQLSAHLVVGADGVRGRLAHHLDALVRRQWPSPSSTFYAYARGLPSDTYQFHVGERSLAGVFPTHDGDGCVWLCLPSTQARDLLESGVSRSDALMRELEGRAPRLAKHGRRVPSANP